MTGGTLIADTVRMAYGILRMAKIKSRVSLLHAAKHHTREAPPDNADPAKAKLNQVTDSSETVMARYSEALAGLKVRKNAVHAVELMMTFSPEKLEGKSAAERADFIASFGSKAKKWADETLGGSQNCLLAALHRDEMTPHVHLIYLPLKDERLNARAFIGGTKDRMRELQDDFYEKVSKPLGLERGLPREQTKRRHVACREYYGKMDKVMAEEIRKETIAMNTNQERNAKIRKDRLKGPER